MCYNSFFNGEKMNLTIHKKNELIRGNDIYSINAKRALNAIYWGLQKHKLYTEEYFKFSFTTLRKMMSLENDNRYIERMKEALQELQQPLSLNNFYHPLQKQTFDWYSIAFIDEVGFIKENNEWIATIKTNPTIKHLMQIEGNFTKLDLVQYINKFRTKYAIKLYEYLKSFDNYRYIDITQQHLIKLFILDKNSKYRYMSDLTILLERQIKELIKKSDLKELKLDNRKELKKEKKFRIYINPKVKKKNASKEELENVLNRIIHYDK